VPYLSASAVVIHYEEALYQVYAPLYVCTWKLYNFALGDGSPRFSWFRICMLLWAGLMCSWIWCSIGDTSRWSHCWVILPKRPVADVRRKDEAPQAPRGWGRGLGLGKGWCPLP